MSIRLTEQKWKVVRKVIFWASLVTGVALTSNFFIPWLIQDGLSWFLVGTWLLSLGAVLGSAFAGAWIAIQILRRLHP